MSNILIYKNKEDILKAKREYMREWRQKNPDKARAIDKKKSRKGNKHDDAPKGGNKSKRGRGTDKTPVVGMVERGGRVRAKKQDKHKLKFKDLRRIVRENIDFKHSKMITDQYRGYTPMKHIIDHETINHQVSYAIGHIHTNTIEGFWAIFKRGIVGQYHKVSIKLKL